MITIQNVTPYATPDEGGLRTYELRINRELIATFEHTRRDGLAVCLLKAAVAVIVAKLSRD